MVASASEKGEEQQAGEERTGKGARRRWYRGAVSIALLLVDDSVPMSLCVCACVCVGDIFVG